LATENVAHDATEMDLCHEEITFSKDVAQRQLPKGIKELHVPFLWGIAAECLHIKSATIHSME
jgi:hypothetical protein